MKDSKTIRAQKLRQSQQLKRRKTRLTCFIEVVIILALIFGLLFTLIYYFGTQQAHTDIPHALDQIFSTTQQKNLKAELEKKKYQHTLLYGANNTGVFEFLEHYADIRASKGNLVIVRRIQNNIYETALKFIRFTKDFIDQNIQIFDQAQKTEWIFIIREGQIPIDQVQKIYTKRPSDRIIVGYVKSQNIKGFKKLAYPEIKIADIRQIIKSELGISKKQAEILTSYYGTIPQILGHLDQISYTHEKHLGQKYQSLKDLGAKQLKTLKNLCKDGQAKLEGNKAALQQIGAVTLKNVVYWNQRVNLLNYQLSQGILCVDKVISEDLRVQLEQERAAEAERYAQNQKQAQEEDEPVKTKAEVKGEVKSKIQKVTNKKQKSAKDTTKQAKQSKATGKLQKVKKQAKAIKQQVKKQATKLKASLPTTSKTSTKQKAKTKSK